VQTKGCFVTFGALNKSEWHQTKAPPICVCLATVIQRQGTWIEHIMNYWVVLA